MTKTIFTTIMLATLMLSAVTILTTQNVFAEDGVLTDEELAALDESTAAVPFVKVDQVNLSSGKQVDIYEGTHTTPFSGDFVATLSGFTIDASPEAKFTLVTADGQGQLVSSTLNFNAGVIANPFVSADGLYWDTVTRDVSAFVSAGDVSATVLQRVSGDCLVHQAIIFAEGTPGDAGGYEAAGVGLRNTGSGIITIAGIPASDTAVKAILYWNLLNPGSPGNMVTFDGNPVAGTLIGTDTDPCWGAVTTWAYRADVTSLISGNGNGAYPITVPSAGSILPEGATLVVIHDVDQLSIILKEIKDIWMAIQNEIIPLLTGIDTTTTDTNNEIRNDQYGLQEIKREVAIIEDTVTSQTDKVSVTVNLDDKLKTGQVMVLLDTTGTGTLSTVHVAASLPCNITGDGKPTAGGGNDAPGVYVVVGEATGALSNLIWDASTDTGFEGSDNTCVYHASVNAGDVAGGVITDVIIIHPDNHPDADKKDIKKHEKLKGLVTVTGTYN